MSITRAELVEVYGQAILSGNAAIFIGAGLSLAAGYPGWGPLLEPMRTRCGIPAHEDLPLLAEYITLDAASGGRRALETHILKAFTASTPDPTRSHTTLNTLDIKEIWTTNYDRLLETAIPDAVVVARDGTIHHISSRRRAIVKMHGSIDAAGQWEQPPVITRTDYERYEIEHPRTWTVLRSSYMSRTMLFLGFSFTDPNIEILLRLARTLGTAAADRHIAVMKSPDSAAGEESRRRDQLRMADLENSGITVCEISDHDEIPELLADLVLRTRPPQLFVSGSAGLSSDATAEQQDEVLAPWCTAIADTLADKTDWTIASLGGRAGWCISRDVARTRRAESTYDPGAMVIHFRRKSGPPVVPDERVGTSIYSDLERDDLVPSVLDRCRALIAIRGGDRTAEEIIWAGERRVAVIPIAAAGGVAREYWEMHKGSPPPIGSRPTDPGTWERLNNPMPMIAARAAKTLLEQAMYETPARS